VFHPSFPFFRHGNNKNVGQWERVTPIEFTNVSGRVKGSLRSVTKPERLRILVQELQTDWRMIYSFVACANLRKTNG